jgi:hypothetical protein
MEQNSNEAGENLKGHFIDLFSIALSDSNLDTKEIEMLYNIGIENGVDREDMDTILRNPHKIRTHIPDNEISKIERLYDFARMAVADGTIDIREVEILKNLCRRFGFLESNICAIVEFLIEESKNETSKEEILNIVRKNILL